MREKSIISPRVRHKLLKRIVAMFQITRLKKPVRQVMKFIRFIKSSALLPSPTPPQWCSVRLTRPTDNSYGPAPCHPPKYLVSWLQI